MDYLSLLEFFGQFLLPAALLAAAFVCVVLLVGAALAAILRRFSDV